jgi:hypothetical protein
LEHLNKKTVDFTFTFSNQPEKEWPLLVPGKFFLKRARFE